MTIESRQKMGSAGKARRIVEPLDSSVANAGPNGRDVLRLGCTTTLGGPVGSGNVGSINVKGRFGFAGYSWSTI